MRRDSHKVFVYSNICHQVSNFMTENVSLIMQINHKEYICPRDKPSSKHRKYNYTETKFGNYQGYLCTIKYDLHETNGLNQLSIGENKLDTTNYISKIQEHIDIALQNGVQLGKVQSLLGKYSCE